MLTSGETLINASEPTVLLAASNERIEELTIYRGPTVRGDAWVSLDSGVTWLLFPADEFKRVFRMDIINKNIMVKPAAGVSSADGFYADAITARDRKPSAVAYVQD